MRDYRNQAASKEDLVYTSYFCYNNGHLSIKMIFSVLYLICGRGVGRGKMIFVSDKVLFKNCL